jgi:5-methylcytosine-specific restriction endonuclease McrA
MAQTLLLNADASPVSMLPLSTLNWQDAVKYMVLNKATVLDWYDDWIVHSQKWSTPVPAVLMLREFQKKKTTIRYSKSNVFLRDDYTCQYCGSDVTKKSATLDHILPTSLGGKSVWENSTTACGPCNANKGNDLRVVPKNKPYKPSYFQLVEKRKKLNWEYIPHKSWLNYLGY